MDKEYGNMLVNEMMRLFDNLSFREKWVRVTHGLRQPPDSGEHKWARLQLTRLWSPFSGVIVPIIVVCLLALLAGLAPKRKHVVNVRIVDVDEQTEFAAQFGLLGIPTIVYLDENGQEQFRHVGLTSKTQLVDALEGAGVEPS